jgi:hypothetical protein
MKEEEMTDQTRSRLENQMKENTSLNRAIAARVKELPESEVRKLISSESARRRFAEDTAKAINQHVAMKGTK